MDDKTYNALIAFAGAIGGAILAALANVYAATRKTKKRAKGL